MQNQTPETGISENAGFLSTIIIRLMVLLSRKAIWYIAGVFIISLLIGYWLGSKLVVSVSSSNTAPIQVVDSQSRIITLIAVTDLSEPQPALLSVWFIHMINKERPVLGFTPVTAVSMIDDENLPKLADFSLDSTGNPSQEFLKSLDKLKVPSSGYILIDRVSSTAFINWINGSEPGTPLELKNHSMAEYGQILRTMCGSLPIAANKGIPEFSWSKITPGNFRTSLLFSQVIENTAFLFANGSPRCEMVPLP